MSFFSTRGGACVTASQSVLWGLAQDGGLYVPSMFPQISIERLTSFQQDSYQQRAARVLRDFLEDYTIAEIESAVNSAYATPSFDDPAIAPVKQLDTSTFVMELFHGPTLAFKDIALSLLPHLVAQAAQKNDEQREISILVATSGDTGKAALEGFKNVPGTSCTVFYPHGGTSAIQQLQMTTTGGANTRVIGVKGNFDDTQANVKRLFSSDAFHQKMNRLGKLPSSANSINLGRLIPQVVYYFTAYTDLVNARALRMGQQVNFVVPTGNFGDILAGYYAKRMGLPIGHLICASNRNSVLTDFFTDGTYYTHRTFFQTMSPSMDILISSNLERLLYESADRDPRLVKTWMDLLAECGSFSIGAQRLLALQKTFWAGFADDTMTAEEIRTVFERKGYLLDPHTAVASHVLEQYRAQTNDHTLAVLVATASPYKFSENVLASLLGEKKTECMNAFACAEALQEHTHMAMPKQIAELKTLPIRHETVCDKADMENALLEEFQSRSH